MNIVHHLVELMWHERASSGRTRRGAEFGHQSSDASGGENRVLGPL